MTPLDTTTTPAERRAPIPLRILLVEDSEHDVLAFRRAFDRSDVDCEITHCVHAEPALERLKADSSLFDIVVTDNQLPGISGLDLCRELLAGKIPLPLVILTGAGTEHLAVEALKAGVDDYLVKDPDHGYLALLPVVLPAVVVQHGDRLSRRRAQDALKEKNEQLEAALAQVKQLSGLLPICANCKKIRNDEDHWQDVAVYVRDHSEAEFSHGLCPDCIAELYPESEL